MKFDPASSVRQAAAVRLMQRVEAITKSSRSETVLAPGDRAPGEALAHKRLMDELEAMRLADNSGGLCIRLNQTGQFYPAKGHWSNKGRYVHRDTIERLIAQGLMRWNNSVRTAAVLTEAGRGECPAETEIWERGLCRRGRNDSSIG